MECKRCTLSHPSTFQTWPKKILEMQRDEGKIQFSKPIIWLDDLSWVYLVSTSFFFVALSPLFILHKPFLYYFNPFCPRRAFISAQGSGAPPRRRQKGLWRSWTCDGGKHPKSVETMARRVGRTGHMLLRLKYFPFLLISIEDEEGWWGRRGGAVFLYLSFLSQFCLARLLHSSSYSSYYMNGSTSLLVSDL